MDVAWRIFWSATGEAARIGRARLAIVLAEEGGDGAIDGVRFQMPGAGYRIALRDPDVQVRLDVPVRVLEGAEARAMLDEGLLLLREIANPYRLAMALNFYIVRAMLHRGELCIAAGQRSEKKYGYDCRGSMRK